MVALKEKIGGGSVFLFSDNFEWARERLEKSFTTNGFELVSVREDKSFLPLEKYTSEFRSKGESPIVFRPGMGGCET